MEQDDLNKSTQEENNKPEIIENKKNLDLNSENEETTVEAELKEEKIIVETESKKKEVTTETETYKEKVPEENQSEKDGTTVKTEPEKEIQEEKKESAADLILKKLKSKTDNDLPVEEKIEKKEENKIGENSVENEVVVDEKVDRIIESDKNIEDVKIEKVDYSNLSMEELIQQFNTLLEHKDIQKVKQKIELVKVNFYKKHHAKIEADKNKFIEDGGKLEEFKPEEDKLEEQFKAFYSVYKERRADYASQLEKDKKTNLEKKYRIIDEIKELINGQESMNKTFQDFKDLQKQWQDAGLVPQSEVKKLWDSYHYWVEKFYDYVNLNKELRDLDLKKNLERKLNLCQKSEELLLEPKVVTAFKILQKLHSLWREIGPVPVDKKDELWERFKKATSTINKKHQEYFENLKNEQLNNFKAKTLLCDKVEETNQLEINTPREWEDQSKEIVDLQRLWKLIGFAPKKDNNQIYARFRKACDTFFNAKREFYSKHKEEEEDNLQLKIELCIEAESMTESTEWRKTTDTYIAIQKKWKTIGPVPRKQKEPIWQRFRTACNMFFDNKSAYYSSLDSAQDENLELKKALIEKINNFDFSDSGSKNFEKLSDIQKQWTDIGYVPLKNKEEIQNEYREAIDKVFEKLDISEEEKMNLKFHSKLENLKNSPNARGRIRSEREKLITRLDKFKGEIVLWENNIGFFAKSKNADSMIHEFTEKIEKAKTTVKLLKQQLYMINDLM
ncbi:MAG: DUF349 domain-containing protein [Bacteroidetes bacterium]|nr:MAG: DUF349 domain-containing protein [Bacteroidota bacterium]